MPQGVEDYDVRKLLEFIVELRRLLDVEPSVPVAEGDIEVATMRMADAVRRIQSRLERARLDEPSEAADYVFEALGGLPASDLSRLLGVSPRTVSAWRHGSTVRQNADRVVIVAQLAADLRGSMTPRGIALWFDASRPQLGGRSPLEVLEERDKLAQLKLLSLARGGRAQLAD
jgi:transcriptional regulator with XRE-family HTH domain